MIAVTGDSGWPNHSWIGLDNFHIVLYIVYLLSRCGTHLLFPYFKTSDIRNGISGMSYKDAHGSRSAGQARHTWNKHTAINNVNCLVRWFFTENKYAGIVRTVWCLRSKDPGQTQQAFKNAIDARLSFSDSFYKVLLPLISPQNISQRTFYRVFKSAKHTENQYELNHRWRSAARHIHHRVFEDWIKHAVTR